MTNVVRKKSAPAKPKSGNGKRLKEAKSKVSIFDFVSYKEYLDALYRESKTTRNSYSYSQFSLDLGFSKSNVIWMVITGRRQLSDRSVPRIIKSLSLTGIEREYFVKLVKYSTARLPDNREKLFNELVQIKNKHLDSDTDQNTLEYFAEWYHPVVREMAGLDEFKSDPEWIANQLCIKVLPAQIKRSLELLESLDLVKYDEKLARHVQTGGHVSPERKVGKMAAIRYHQKMCEIAKESVTRTPPDRREYNAITLRLSDESATKLAEEIGKVCDKVVNAEKKCEDKDQVYHVNLQLFPLTKK